MVNEHTSRSEFVVTAWFCEPFAAASAIRALTQVGFNDADIELIGVLGGSIPNLRWLCTMGIPAEQAWYYQTCFEEGGVLLFVPAAQHIKRQIALAVLEQEGGILPPTVRYLRAQMAC